ncbi:MAG: efflux RND transporter periplasmic adaptor subunit [Candidatus Hydrogenedentes bacterium]|nr:efflux RND transporter periplasmic adaptor subunit [Candidatus Hydrogenedentota bacterium]
MSPLDGVITQLPVRLGMAVQPQSAVATIMNPSVLLAEFRIPSASLNGVHENAAVEVVVPSIDNAKASGTVERIGKVADAVTGDVVAFARVPNQDGHLRPGLACRVAVALPEVPDALVIPVAAIANRAGEPVVTVVRDGKAHEVPVALGVRTADLAQIVQGLAAGDVVATESGYGLPDDCPVVVEKEN